HIYMDDVFRNGSAATDVLVLGCTHYPLLRPLLRRIVPPTVAIVDSAESTAAAVAKLAGRDGLLPVSREAQKGVSTTRFFATDSTEKFRKLGERFLGHAIDGVEHVDLEKLI